VIFEKFVWRNCHDDLARLIFDERGKREHSTVSQPAEQAEKEQEPEQTISGELRPRSGTADKTALAEVPIAGIWNRGFASEP
jgi:hypothetical protein